MLSVHNAIYDYRIILNLKQHSIITDTQAIFWGEIGKTFDIASESATHLSKFGSNPSRILFLQSLQILDGFSSAFIFCLGE